MSSFARLLPCVHCARLLRGTVFLALVSGWTGCATTWSESDRNKLAAVSVSATSVAAAAYQKPDATDSPGMSQGIPAATGGGLIPALLGSAVDAVVTAKQQRKFEETNRVHFAALQDGLATPPNQALDAALKEALSHHEFFGSRLVEESATAFRTEILHYGLQKSPLSVDDDILLRVRIITKINLTLPDSGKLFEAQITGVASTAKRAAEILADPDFLVNNVTEAAEDFAEQLVVQLNAKLTAKK